MTVDIDADTTGNRTSDASSSSPTSTISATTATTTMTTILSSSSPSSKNATSNSPPNIKFINTNSSISVSNAVSKIDALINANNNGTNNGVISANFPRANGRKMKPLVAMPSLEVSADTNVATSDNASDSNSSIDSTSITTTLPMKTTQQQQHLQHQQLQNSSATLSIFQRDDDASTGTNASPTNPSDSVTNHTKSIDGDVTRIHRTNDNEHMHPHQHNHHHHHHHHNHPPSSSPTQKDSIVSKNFYHAPPDRFNMMPINVMTQRPEELDDLGPLPPKWEKAFTENDEAYFIDHNTGTSHWLDPRLSKFQKKSLEECSDDELPYGWEKIHDPQYGTYYIDHVNRRTQYENPVLEAKRRSTERQQNGSGSGAGSNCGSSIVDSVTHQQQTASLKKHNKQSLEPKPNLFTKNPSELYGEKITATLLKSSRGLGFTIVGGDDNVEEFLQIKSIVPNGQAWLDGKLQMGDVLVYVNDICVLGFTHHEMVNIFQSISPGETVSLEVCRGYPLPFDPNDPNTEVIQTIAVDGLTTDPEKARILMDLNMDGNYNFLDVSDTSPQTMANTSSISMQHHGPAKFESNSVRSDVSENFMNESRRDLIAAAAEKPEILIISIMKGPQGFGFTIADSAYGQKVKEILDRNCCKNLQVGDYLLAINNTSVMYMSHSAVVQVLKTCPKNEEAILKIQRGHYFNGNTNDKSNRTMRRGLLDTNSIDRSTAAALNNIISKENAIGIYRSKTPTADLYSTQPKEILPTRSKTPLVDTRARVKTPLNELNGGSDSVDHHRFPDQDSINNEAPFIDSFPKMMLNLSERLADTSIVQPNSNNYEQNSASSDYYVNYNAHMGVVNGGYTNSPNNSIYAVSANAKMPIMAPVPTYHHDHCYCYECQDYNRHQNAIANNHFNNNNGLRQSGNMRHNDYMYEQHDAANFSPLESHAAMQYPHKSMQQQQQQHQQQHHADNNYWPHKKDTVSQVTLHRQSAGFGFRIFGGTEEGSQVAIGHIVPNGSADNNPLIATGDEIMCIDGHNAVNESHHRVVELMSEAAQNGQVTMVLLRKSQNPNLLEMNHQRQHQHQHQHQHQFQPIQYPYDVMLSRNENESFGIVVISAPSPYDGSTIGRLIPGSPADQCEVLKIGDRIIAVNRIDISGMPHNDVVNLIKESGLRVRLTIGHPKVGNNIQPSQSN